MTLPRLDGPALLADQVFESMRAAILTGDLPAGQRLRIRDLAAEVGTSVMPVREAIRRLEEAGLAERVPHRGAVVRGLTLAELVNVYDVRMLLEVEAARLGAAVVDADAVARMRTEYDSLRAAVAAGRANDVLDHDEAMLTALYEASGNPVLLDTISTMWQRCRPYKTVGARATLGSADATPLWTYQRDLAQAAAHGDAAAAAQVVHDSLANATARIRAELAASRA